MSSELFKYVHRKEFLEKLFPDGLNEPVLIAQLCLDLYGHTIINIHTRQCPAVEVKKWGAWGVNYNVIVVKLLGMPESEFNVKGWPLALYADVAVVLEDDKKFLVQYGEEKNLKIEFSDFIFQGCVTYLDE